MFKFVIFLSMLCSASVSLEISQAKNDGWSAETCNCPLTLYDPICGSDGKTYNYECFLECAKQQNPDLEGVCYGTCPCCKEKFRPGEPSPYHGNSRSVPKHWGQQSSSWNNAQDSIVQNKTLSSRETTATYTVVEEIEGCPCEKIWKPVCGSDNVTYGNACVFDCQKEQQEPGSCLTQSCPGICPCCSCEPNPAA